MNRRCPVCNARGVSVQRLFRNVGRTNMDVPCEVCGVRVTISSWARVAYDVVVFLPAIVLLLAVASIPHVGLLLAFAATFPVVGLQVVILRLVPVPG